MSPCEEGAVSKLFLPVFIGLGAVLAPIACTSMQGPARGDGAAAVGPLDGFPQAPASPVLPREALTRIGLASCANEERAQPAFTALRAAQPDLVILAGDNVYGSSTPADPQLSDLRAAYFQQSRRPEFAALVSQVPTLAVWDDHDFGSNDAGGDFKYKHLAQQMFDAFWRIAPDDPRAHSDGVFGSWIIGPVGRRTQIILLDTRYWRSPLKRSDAPGAPGRERYLPDEDPSRTMLGATQWAWLAKELQKPAELRLVVSSVQLAADGHGWERWGNFPHERQRFYDLIKASGAKGVVVLSGDRHHASINVGGRDTVGYPVYDMTASSINMPWSLGAEEAGPNRVAGPIGKENFGFLTIDWASRRLTLEVRDAQGASAFSRAVEFAEIGAG
jgi:alkaline phosphatase D